MKKKVLLITLNPCYPLVHGGALAQFYFLDGLKNDIDFVLCTMVNSSKEKSELDLLQNRLPGLKIYFLNNQSNEIKVKPFSKRIISSIKKFLFPKTKITSVTESDDYKDAYFQHIDNAFNYSFIELIHSVIEIEQITQVQFDFYNTIDLCFTLPEHVKKIFVNHEVRFKRLFLSAEMSNVPVVYKKFLLEKTKFFEQYCITRMDDVVVFNEDDASILRPYAKKITVSPFGIPDELIFDLKLSAGFKRLLFIGGEGHTPNLLGLTWFIENLYLPNIEEIIFPLYIIGEWSDSFKQRYSKNEKIIFCGIVDSVSNYFEFSVFINPILTGAGLRTKVLHAFANKVPVLSTRFGAEGCFTNENYSHLGLFDSYNELKYLIENSDFNILAQMGFDFYNREFQKEKLLKKRISIYQ